MTLADTRSPTSLSTRLRAKRDRLLCKVILDRRATVAGPFRILDLGGTADYWRRVGFDWLERHDIDITCVNATATEFGVSERESARLHCIVGNACAMDDYLDDSFDFVHSNSVIEHVGRWREMVAFARECCRLAPAYYVQTPYFWFPFDPHFPRLPFYHWLPEAWRLRLLRQFKIGWAAAQPDVDIAMHLVESNAMLCRLRFRYLFADATHRFEWFAGLPKSMIAVRA